MVALQLEGLPKRLQQAVQMTTVKTPNPPNLSRSGGKGKGPDLQNVPLDPQVSTGTMEYRFVPAFYCFASFPFSFPLPAALETLASQSFKAPSY